MGPWNFHQYMHPFDSSLEFKAVSSDAMKPQLLRNFCEFPSTQDGIPSLHVYVMDNWMLNKDSAKGTECVCSGAAEQPPDYCKTPSTALVQTGAL
jgi:hypothetical protein